MGLYYRPLEPSKNYELLITGTSIAAFKELVQRGANLWPDAPAEIKEFADLVTTGKVLQDYQAQEHNRKQSTLPGEST